jgi:hypothetical protein
MAITYAGQGRSLVLSNAVFSTTGGNSGELDLAGIEGTVRLTVNDRASGTAAATISVTHSETTSTGFTAVPADALFDLETGDAATFANLSTSASDQTLGLLTQRCKQFVRVEIAGTGMTHNLAIVAAVGDKYAPA